MAPIRLLPRRNKKNMSITEAMFRDAHFPDIKSPNLSGDRTYRKLATEPPGPSLAAVYALDRGQASSYSLCPPRARRSVLLGPSGPRRIRTDLYPTVHLISLSLPHGRRTSRDRDPPGAAAIGHDIHHPPTPSPAIPDHRCRYRSHQRPFRRTRPSLVEGRGGEGVVGVWRQLSGSNVGR